MIPRKAFIPFLMREHKQGVHLIEGLRGYHQKSCDYPEREVRRLRSSRIRRLAAYNPHAREFWMRGLGGGLCQHVGARAPDWEPRIPVYFITLIDKRQIAYPAGSERGWRPAFEIGSVRRHYRRALRGFDYLGMLDPALYVSAQRVQGVPRFILWHAHALVWNTSECALDAWADELRPVMHAYLPYATGVDWRPIQPGHLRQMIWYTAKTPRHQYQLFKRDTGSLKQYDGPINGVNAVRLYSEMKNMTLPELTLAGGAGRRIVRETIEASAGW